MCRGRGVLKAHDSFLPLHQLPFTKTSPTPLQQLPLQETEYNIGEKKTKYDWVACVEGEKLQGDDSSLHPSNTSPLLETEYSEDLSKTMTDWLPL